MRLHSWGRLARFAASGGNKAAHRAVFARHGVAESVQSALCRAAGRLGIFATRSTGCSSNVCPEIDPPPRRRCYAFSYHRAERKPHGAQLVAAGSGEAREGRAPAMKGASFGAATSHLRRCARKRASCSGRWTAAHGGARLRLGGGDRDPGLYGLRHPSAPADEIVRRGANRGGLTWHFARPPVQGLDFEMMTRVGYEFVNLTLRLRLRVGALQKHLAHANGASGRKRHGAVKQPQDIRSACDRRIRRARTSRRSPSRP